ncbi:MAG: type II secretion system F family protein [Acidobacteriota bacterium]|nr:type II secretion system F family protein [Acidobacteriota bacterium]
MATFRVKLGTSDGELATREAHGNSVDEITAHFVNEGYFVFNVQRQLDISGWVGLKRKIPSKQFITFNKEFRGLVRAGLPIAEGFDIILKRMKPGRLRTLLEDVREKLHKGQSLSEAFRSFGDVIPRYYSALIHAGEQSGGLTEVLDRFIEQEGRIRRARKRFLQALTYPSILLGAGIIAMYIILTRAMPQFTEFYNSADRQLPPITQVVMDLSNWVGAWSGWLIGGALATLVLGHLYLQTENGGLMGERLVRRVPLVGRLWYLSSQNIFARTMRMLTHGGIPVPQALAVVAGAMPSRLFGKELSRAHEAVTRGESLQEALDAKTSFNEEMGEMIRIGEATGNLGDMLDYLAESGEEQAEDTLAMLSNLVAPLMLLAIGLMIAFLVAAMYLPMFGSYDAMME